ncbi:2OG-Fe(II) oxygenase [[Empedobacter] haloabium]|uniref:2OG-Fe(II) oxygenase n=1 Tax=[Empedobacter] haloabium TaxID=592317 RepID=A0ABZ1UFH8_9BURK
MHYLQELQQYVERQHADGKNFSQIVIALAVQSGYSQHVAQRIVEAVLDCGGNDCRLPPGCTADGSALPEIDTSGERTVIELADRRVTIAFEQCTPRMVLLDGFLSDEECDELCQVAQASLEEATVYDAGHVEGVLLKSVRDCDVMGLATTDSPVVAVVERRIEELTAWPQAWGEPLQVQRYRENGKFEPHYDFFMKKSRYYDKELKFGGQRLATLIIYLRQPEAGGATYFANLGMRVMPRKGSALFFAYPIPSAQSGTLHGGDPVRGGEKWIMTKWFREGPVARAKHEH